MNSGIATKVKALVLRTAGTNCEDETARALQRAGADAEVARTAAAARDADRLGGYGILVFAGGFSYGDDLGSGRVWGHELRTGGLRDALRRHVDRGGLIVGLCNGFQVLVESGLFEPDKAPEERSIALYANASNHYECRWVTLREHGGKCAWLTDGLEWPCPVAHGEGRFVVRDAATLERLRANGTAAVRVALELRDARCDDKAGLFERVSLEGDDRALMLLERLRGTNCQAARCCYVQNGSLKTSIKSLKRRHER
jgi:phosphoribosylformylglycinamidine synthase